MPKLTREERHQRLLEQMGEFTARLQERLAAEDELTDAINEKYKDEPMISPPVWHTHTP